MQEGKPNYNDEPVEYCTRCYSLKIKHEDAIDADVCAECGCTEIASTDIETWEKLYEKRYRRKYVTCNHDPRSSVYFKLPISTLKTKLYKDNRLLATVLHKLYPTFPRGLSREDAILVLFDKVSKDSMMDDLRMCFYDYYMINNNKQLTINIKDNGREES